MLKTCLGILCAAALLIACAPPETDTKSLIWETLAQGASYQPGCDTRTDDDRLIRTDAEWVAYWNEVHPESPQPPLPAVDFAHESVLATCGWHPDPGHYSAITDVQAPNGPLPAPERVEDHVTVSVTDTRPGERCFSPQIITYGHHAVRVNRVVSRAEFAHGQEQGPACGEASGPFTWETLAQGYYSGCGDAGDWVIRTEQEWEAFWTQLYSTFGEPPPRPAVDFATASVLATCMGTRSTGGYAIRITEVAPPDEVSGRVNVSVDDSEPGEGCGVTTALTEPYHVVKVNRAVAGADYAHTARVHNCS